ncbi:SLC13 family permease [Salirhabdus salicampi]|uniref:SLC13 family permease n=1 Tax=Salirhabdus salicampi TaxID=476102 RepID=UPI0020C56179|nr:SLC13 family permease [Salirhabdus salicampi]MCP8617509.1 SLC13 family permease [Salirhabdus salicampi]
MLTTEMTFLLIVLTCMFIALLAEVARPDVVLLSTLLVLLISGVLTAEEAFRGFSNEGLVTIGFLFIVAGAVQKSGIVDRFVQAWLVKSRSEQGVLFRFLTPLSFFSSFLNNTPIVVTFTPVLRKWCEKHNIAPSKLLIPLSYVTTLGGTITLIGTSTNLIVHGMLIANGYDGFSMFQLAVIGVPITIVGILYISVIGFRLLPIYESVEKQRKEETKQYIAELTVDESFRHVNNSVKDAGLRDLQGLYLIEIIRKEEKISPVKSSTLIQAGDRLIFTGLISTLAELQTKKGLTVETGSDLSLDDLRNGNTALVEAVVSHQSSLLDQTIKEARFRSKFDASIVAVHRNNERIQSKIGDIKLKPGDTLLLLAGTDFLQQHYEAKDFYVLSPLNKPKQVEGSTWKGMLSLSLFLIMIIAVMFHFVSMVQGAAFVVFLLLLTKTVSFEEIKGYIQFQVLLTIASAFGIGIALSKTGLAQMIADAILSISIPLGTIGILTILYITTNLLTEMITNSAAAAIMLPIALQFGYSLQMEPIGFAMVIAIAASASFLTPIGYQTNLIVYGPGGYTFTDYIKVGLPLTLLVMVMTVTIVTFVTLQGG